MNVYELTYPGVFLEHQDRAWANEARTMLSLMEGAFSDATVAVNLFEIEYQQMATADSKRRDEITKRRAEVKAHLEKHLRPPDDPRLARIEQIAKELDALPKFEGVDRIELRAYHATKIYNRERREAGERPEEFRAIPLRIYARAFIHALHVFEKALRVLVEDARGQSALADILKEFNAHFPGFRGVRDTLEHVDERIRRLARKKEVIPQPIDNGAIKSGLGNVLIIEGLYGTSFQCTTAEGELGSVDVSLSSLQRLQEVLQSVINAFAWHGPRRPYPN